MKIFQNYFKATLIFSAGILIGGAAIGSTNDATNVDVTISPPAVIETARGFYNAGTQQLRAGKLSEAEALLQSSVSKQDERIQPAALYNLGQVRFDQGNEELKKSPSAPATASQSGAASDSGANAIQKAESALAGNDVQQMVDAYIAGRGARKELRAATDAVRSAMEAHGKTLLKWRRSLGDFKGAAELNPADTNATQNVEIVERAIAKLVDSMKQMQQSGASLGGKQAQLGVLLKMLKGRIPGANMPPGAAGKDGDEDEGEGKGLPPESLAGLKESTTGGGQEMELKISPETAGQLLNGIQPDGKLLPMGQGEMGKPKDNSKRIW